MTGWATCAHCHPLSLCSHWKLGASAVASVLRTIVAMGPFVAPRSALFGPSKGLASPQPGRASWVNCPPPLLITVSSRGKGASSLPSTYFQLSYILHKVNLANREHSENIFGFEASVF